MNPPRPVVVSNPQELGRKLEACELGSDCPFEGAVRRLEKEQHDRIASESTLAVQIDVLAAKIEKLVTTTETQTLRIQHLEFYLRIRRLVDLAVLGIGAGLGGFLAKLLVQ